VDVDVDVQDAFVVLEQLEDGEHNVIGIAKAGRFRFLGVMQPARPIDGNVGSALVELDGTA
jgi:hypothetical protein